MDEDASAKEAIKTESDDTSVAWDVSTLLAATAVLEKTSSTDEGAASRTLVDVTSPPDAVTVGNVDGGTTPTFPQNNSANATVAVNELVSS